MIQRERIGPIDALGDVWLAEVRAEALVGDERSTDVLVLLESYEGLKLALRESIKREAVVSAELEANERALVDKPVANIGHLSPHDPIHHWFELSYAQFLTLPRLFLTSMPLAWQQKMAALLIELDATFDWHPRGGRWWVSLKDERGRYAPPEHCDYRHGSVEYLRKQTPAPIGGDANG